MILLAATAAGFAGGWQTRAWKAGADDRDRIVNESTARALYASRANVAAGGYEAKRATSAARERTIAPEVARVVADPALAVQCLSADGLRILADDVAQHGIARQPGAAVPAAASAATR